MTGSGLVQRAVAGFDAGPPPVGWLDHLVRAGVRYDQADGGRLAAAVTYYAFFAAFSLALLGFAILGHVLDDPAVLRAVQGYLSQNLPRLDAQALREPAAPPGWSRSSSSRSPACSGWTRCAPRSGRSGGCRSTRATSSSAKSSTSPCWPASGCCWPRRWPRRRAPRSC